MAAPLNGEHCGTCGAELALDGVCPACMLDRGWMTDEQKPAAAPNLSLQSFGDYELIEEIARGGMGVVYKARQRSLNRVVAVKMVLAGRLAKQSDLQRFRAEAETAARLQHPNIVAIHEVGEFEGQPFFSMDYVEGQNLAELAHNQPLPVKRAAAYLKTIAEAVVYAHAKGVLHRDLKPSNILIDQNDQPRITDFGLAKRLPESTASHSADKDGETVERVPSEELTISGQVLGSPNFMPPEQAMGNRKAIGPASDVYSLGAILYQLLTGRPPFMAETLTQTLRLVAETEPVSPRLLNPGVPGDLETVCMKCLEKAPQRRYPTAQDLVADLSRFLEDQPVVARPVGVIEKSWRWCRRNRALAGTLAAMLALLLVVAIGSPIAAFKINRERLRSETARKLAVEQETKARTEAAKSQQVAQFLKDMLQGVTPLTALGRDTTLLRDILEKTGERVGRDLTNQPAVEAELRNTLGKVFEQIGEYDKAEQMLRRSLAINRELFGNDHPEVATSLASLGWVLYYRGNTSESVASQREALAIRRRAFGEQSLEATDAQLGLGWALYVQQPIEAESVLRETLAVQKKIQGDEHPDVATSLIGLSLALQNQNRLEEAEAALREAVAIRAKVFGSKNPSEIRARGQLADLVKREGKLDEAGRIYREVFADARSGFGNDPAGLTSPARDLKDFLLLQGRFAEAEQALSEVITPTILGQPGAAGLLTMRGELFARQGRWREAIGDMVKAANLDPTNWWYNHGLTALDVAAGDVEGYRHQCQNVVARYGNTTDPVLAERMAKVCLALPEAGVDMNIITQMVRVALSQRARAMLTYSEFVAGLAEYRQEHFASSVEWAQKVLARAGEDDYRDVEALMLLAMARYRLHQTNEASSAFAEGVEINRTGVPKLEDGDVGPWWNYWIITQALVKEARTLIEGTTADPAEAHGWGVALARAGRLHQSAIAEALAKTRSTPPSFISPPRSADCPNGLIDLSAWFNAGLASNWQNTASNSDLSSLPTGVQKLGIVEFDIRGVIQLTGNSSGLVYNYPLSVQGIRIERRGAALHFLHATSWGVQKGVLVGEYVIHRADGSAETAALVFGENVADWYASPKSRSIDGKTTRIAWKGECPTSRSYGQELRLYDFVWENSKPDVAITTIDFSSALTKAAPFLLAITVDAEVLKAQQ